MNWFIWSALLGFVLLAGAVFLRLCTWIVDGVNLWREDREYVRARAAERAERDKRDVVVEESFQRGSHE